MANTGYTEIEQVDRNPNSSTFNQVRWVAGNQNLTLCPLPNAPDTTANWQATGLKRCQLDSNNANTGWQEVQEKDVNSESATYNQLRWVQGAYSSEACPVTDPEYFYAGALLRQVQVSLADACAYSSTTVTNAYTPTGYFTVGVPIRHYLIKPDGTEDETGTPSFAFADGYYRVSASSQVVQVAGGEIASVSTCQ